MAARNLRQVLLGCQREVWDTDCTWAKALQNAYRAGEMVKAEHDKLFELCLKVARPGLDTKDVIPLVIQQVDMITGRNLPDVQ